MISFGYYTCCIEVWDENYDAAIDKAKYVVKLLNSTGFGAKIEKSNSFQAWLGSLPGNNYSNVRKTLLTSGNCAHLIPLSSLWSGEFYNEITKINNKNVKVNHVSTEKYLEITGTKQAYRPRNSKLSSR